MRKKRKILQWMIFKLLRENIFILHLVIMHKYLYFRIED